MDDEEENKVEALLKVKMSSVRSWGRILWTENFGFY